MNILGLDVSQDTLDCYLIKQKGITDYLKVSNDSHGFKHIVEWLKQHRIRKIAVCMEATGIYYEKAAYYFNQLYAVYVVNPLKTKEYAKSRFQRTKTDKIDAKLIAEYAQRHRDILQPYQKPTEQQQRLQRLLTLQHQLKQQIKQAKNRIHACQDGYIVDVHQSILKVLQDRLAETASQIYSLMKQQSIWQHYQNLLTIPGMGKESIPIVLYYLNQRQFKSVNQFIAFAGLNPDTQQSGTSVNRKLGSGRYGNRKLKRVFFMPVLVAYRLGVFRQLVINLERRKKPKMVILGAIMRKLAKIAYYLYKTNQPFDKARYQMID